MNINKSKSKSLSKQYDVMVAGHLCFDIIPRFANIGAGRIDEIMHPGKLVNVEDATINTGGTASNTGTNMKKLGNCVCFCAWVGDDELGP